MAGNGQELSAHLPITGYFAIYTLNLIVLRTLLAPNGYTFDETKHTCSEDGTRAWDRLTYLWRSWFSLETLNELAAILIATREDTKIHLKIKDQFTTSSSDDRLESIFNVSLALADDITIGLSGLLSYDSFGKNSVELSVIDESLRSENVNLQYELLTKRLRSFHWRGYDYRQFEHLFQEILHSRKLFEISQYGNSEAIVSFLQEFVRLIRVSDIPSSIELYDRLIRDPFIPKFNRNIFLLEIIRLARELDDLSFLNYLYKEHLQRYTIRGGEPGRVLPMELVIETIKLAREFEDRRYSRGFLSRIPTSLPKARSRMGVP